MFNTHGNWGCECNGHMFPEVCWSRSLPAPWPLRSVLSPFPLVQVLPLKEHGFDPQTWSSSRKIHKALQRCWNLNRIYRERIHIPPGDKENHRLKMPLVGDMWSFSGGSLTRSRGWPGIVTEHRGSNHFALEFGNGHRDQHQGNGQSSTSKSIMILFIHETVH